MSPTCGISSKGKLSRIHILGLCGRLCRASSSSDKSHGIGALSTAASEIFTVIIFLLSLKYGFKNIRRIDKYCLIIALVGIIPWLLTKDPTISVVIAVSIDLFAFSSTVRKTWNEPKTETPTLYGMNVLRHIVTLFSFEAYNVATTLHSIVMIAANSLMTGLILSKNPKRLDKMKGRLMVAFQRLTRSSALAITILNRILAGVVFFSEGIQKFLFSNALGVGRFAKIGIPEPLIVAPFVGVVEIAFGAFILLGFLARSSAVPLLLDISVAIATTKVRCCSTRASGPPHMRHAPTSPCCLD